MKFALADCVKNRIEKSATSYREPMCDTFRHTLQRFADDSPRNKKEDCLISFSANNVDAVNNNRSFSRSFWLRYEQASSRPHERWNALLFRRLCDCERSTTSGIFLLRFLHNG